MNKKQLEILINLVIDRHKEYKDSQYQEGYYEISGNDLVKFQRDLVEILYEFIGSEKNEAIL